MPSLNPAHTRLCDETLAQFGYFLIRILLDLDRRRSDSRMLLRPIFEITICDLKREFFLICSEILGS